MANASGSRSSRVSRPGYALAVGLRQLPQLRVGEVGVVLLDRVDGVRNGPEPPQSPPFTGAEDSIDDRHGSDAPYISAATIVGAQQWHQASAAQLWGRRKTTNRPRHQATGQDNQCCAPAPDPPLRGRQNDGLAASRRAGCRAMETRRLRPTWNCEEGALLLRPWRAEDADAVYRACQDPEIARWTMVPQPYRMEHAVDYVTTFTRSTWAHGTGAPFGRLRCGDGRHAGLVRPGRSRPRGPSRRTRLLGGALGARPRGRYGGGAGGVPVGTGHAAATPAGVAGEGRQPPIPGGRGSDRGPVRGRASGRNCGIATAGLRRLVQGRCSPASCGRRMPRASRR